MLWWLGPGVRAQELDRAFAPPMLWERFTDASFSAGPYRSFADGRGGVLLVGNGGADIVAGVWHREPIRMLESNATVDATFQSAVPGGFAMAVQPDGKVLLTGSDASADVVYRLLPSGALDPGFTPVGFDQGIRHLTVLPGGKILVVVWGNFLMNPSPWAIPVAEPTVFRLHANGRVDTTFRRPTFAGVASLFVPPVLDGAGRIYLGGRFSWVNGLARATVVRLLPTGEVDESFVGSATVPGGLGGTARGIGIQSDGRVVVAGDLRIPSTATFSERTLAIRFDGNGQFDGSFVRSRVTSLGLGDYPRAMVALPDDRFVLVSAWLRRFEKDGALDPGFAGPNFANSAFWITRLSDGRFLIPGANSEDGVAVFGVDGAPDPSFRTGGFGRATFASSHAFLTGGGLALSGAFNRVGSAPQLGLAILDGGTGEPRAPQPDLASVAPAGAVMSFGRSVFRVAPGPTNTCWVLSEVMDTNGLPHTYFGRMLGSGEPDAAVGLREVVLPDPLAGATDLEALPDGRLWVVANSAQAAVDGRPLLRLLADGTVDEAFGGADPELVRQLGRVVYLPDNAIGRLDLGSLRILGRSGGDRLLAAVNTVDGEAHLVRMNHDGRLDPAFAGPVVTGLGSVLDFVEIRNPRTGVLEQPWDGAGVYNHDVFRAAAELPGGDLYVAGRFYELGGAPVTHLARLKPDGTLDRAFAGVRLDYSQSPFVEPEVHALAVDGRGRAYIAGAFDHVNRHPAAGLARLLADGTVDATFSSPLRFEPADFRRLRLQLIGDQLYVFGGGAEGSTRRMAWRLRVEERLTLTFDYEPGEALFLSVPSSPTGAVVVEASEDLRNWREVFRNAAGAPPASFRDSGPASELRFFRLRQ